MMRWISWSCIRKSGCQALAISFLFQHEGVREGWIATNVSKLKDQKLQEHMENMFKGIRYCTSLRSFLRAFRLWQCKTRIFTWITKSCVMSGRGTFHWRCQIKILGSFSAEMSQHAATTQQAAERLWAERLVACTRQVKPLNRTLSTLVCYDASCFEQIQL